jgi:hypothetical protein
MASTVKCPHCGKNVELSDAFKHEIENELRLSITSEVEATARKKVTEDFELKFKSLREESEEQKQKNIKLQDEISELLKEVRKAREEAQEEKINAQKLIAQEEEKIKLNAKLKFEEEHQLKDLEKDKKLADALQQVEILKTKMQQGSQQTQGESMELELEQKLKSEFPMDQISEVKKGARGADLVQKVVDKLGRSCGTILWESKNAKWSESWITKLKEDGRQAKADLLVLVSNQLPQGADNFLYMDGVWICNMKNYLPLAWSLRFNLVSLYHEKQASEGKDEKMKLLYSYLSGSEFKNRVEGIVEAFSNLQDELEKEKRFFNTKWARQEKEIRKVIDHTHGMMGDLQGITQLKNLELMELDSGD